MDGKYTVQGSLWGMIMLFAVALYQSQSCNCVWKKDMGNIPGDWLQTSFAQGQLRKTWMVISGCWHWRHWLSICVRPKVRNYLVGSRLRIAFQKKIWIFFGHCNAQIQFQTGLFQGTCFCWKRNLEADLTEQVPLLWGHRKVSTSLAKCATRIP